MLGGDKHVGRPRCVEHAWQLRQAIRERHPSLELGGWANPSAEAGRQIDYLLEAGGTTDFYLTQIASHHQAREVDAFLARGAPPRSHGAWRSSACSITAARSRATLATLQRFLPVPVDELTAEFAAGATPVDVCARTIRSLRDLGVQHFYVSNLPLRRTAQTLNAILDAGVLRC